MTIKESSEIRIGKRYLELALNHPAKPKSGATKHPSDHFRSRRIASAPKSLVEDARRLMFDSPRAAVSTQANASTSAVIMALNC